MNKVLLGEARFYFAQCVFNTSCQYAAYDRYYKKRNIKQNLAIGIACGSVVVMGITIIAWEFCQSMLAWVSVIGLVFTVTSLIFELYNRNDLSEIMFYHKQAAEDYKKLREQFMDIIRQIKDGADEMLVETTFQKCLYDYCELGRYSLQTTSEDYLNTQETLGLHGQGEAFTWHSYEIDKFLPNELRENIDDKE